MTKKHTPKNKTRNFSLNFVDDHKKQVSFLLIFLSAAIIFIGIYFLISFILSARGINIPTPFKQNVTVVLDSKDILQPLKIPKTTPRRIDGVIVATEDANRVPACVMIENAAFGGVRPQSGLSKANVVYELIVEGGITRFMAIYAGETSNEVGPVRSARDTYLEYVSEYNCAYNHAGGSYTAMLAIQTFKLRNIDALQQGQYFWRASNKISPHNLFTSTENLYTAIDDHNWNNEEKPNYDSWSFVDDEKIEKTEENNRVAVFFGGAYDTEFIYNTEKKSYERKNGGINHIDATTGEVLTARNVILQHVGEGIPIEGKGRINWPVTGEGNLDIFRLGQHIQGTWKKENRQSRTQYFDQNGKEIDLIRGNSWVQIIPPNISFEYN